jgi:hypothetical protein
VVSGNAGVDSPKTTRAGVLQWQGTKISAVAMQKIEGIDR